MGEILKQIKAVKVIESGVFHEGCLNITAILENGNREKKTRLIVFAKTFFYLYSYLFK